MIFPLKKFGTTSFSSIEKLPAKPRKTRNQDAPDLQGAVIRSMKSLVTNPSVCIALCLQGLCINYDPCAAA